MKRNDRATAQAAKVRTGIEGLDEITHGGLPRGRTTLLEGGPGCGKTVLALQTLVHGVRHDHEPGIFVAFEESAERIVSNASSFGWDLPALQQRDLFFLDAQPSPDLVTAGEFDLHGLLQILEAKARQMKARRIVLDALDVVLALLDDPAARRRELLRLHDWLLAGGFTAIVTAKAETAGATAGPRLSFTQFMVECVLTLNHEFVSGISQRHLRVVKYRGSAFSENDSPFLIGPHGLEVAGVRELEQREAAVSNERVSSGVARLDQMLGGGYFRGASVLFTGFPGTAKTTLAGAFAEACCRRGERTLMVSFDSSGSEIVRNLASVDIRLAGYLKRGLLRVLSLRAVSGSAELHLMQIKRLALEHRARNLIIDPVSALGKMGNESTAHRVAERLVDWTKSADITLACTSLLDEAGQQLEGTPLEISTVADTWIHLSYVSHAGERNRALSIVKSRGTAHSNQVRELVLDERGVTLADAYTAGGEVLMGTLRWQKEREEMMAREESEHQARARAAQLAQEEEELRGKLKAIQRDLRAKTREKKAAAGAAERRRTETARSRSRMHNLRGADAP